LCCFELTLLVGIRLSGKWITCLELEIYLLGFSSSLIFQICEMDPSLPLLFGAPVYFACEYQDMLVLELATLSVVLMYRFTGSLLDHLRLDGLLGFDE